MLFVVQQKKQLYSKKIIDELKKTSQTESDGLTVGGLESAFIRNGIEGQRFVSSRACQNN